MIKVWQVVVLGVCVAMPSLTSAQTSRRLNLELQTTKNRNYINASDCEQPDQRGFQLTWSATSSNDAIWINVTNPIATVFLSKSNLCTSKDIEIDKDVEIPQVLTGTYKDDIMDWTLSDLVATNSLDCASKVFEQDYKFCIQWEVEITEYYGKNTYKYTGVTPSDPLWFRFDFKAPDKPVLSRLLSGDGNLRVQWKSEDPDKTDIDFFSVHYREAGSQEVFTRTSPGLKAEFLLDGLTNGKTYEVWLSAVDKAQNESEPSASLTGIPVEVDDFFEHYKNSGGSETGGFCFVATAAFGSYQDSMVQPLRNFRDQVLLESEAGRNLVSGYYQYGPRWARAIRDSDFHRSMAKWSLAPVVGLIQLWQSFGLIGWVVLLVPLAFLALGLRRRLKSFRPIRSFAKPVGVFLVFSGLGANGLSAQAQTLEERGAIPDFQLQLRLGPYKPQIDSETDLSGQPFRDIFGSSNELLFELGMDYQIWHGFGTFSAGVSFGFVQYLGKGRFSSGEEAHDTTVLNLIPLRWTLAWHADMFMRFWRVPLVPYVGGGLSYYFWWITDGVGDVAQWKNAADETVKGRGGIFGLHFSLGLKLLLDALDQEAAMKFENDMGVINTYFFAEFAYSWVNGFGTGNHLNLGDENFMFGLSFEF